MTDVKGIVEAVKSVLPKTRPIHHHTPWFDSDEASEIEELLIFGELDGTTIKKFEDRLRQYTGSEQVVAVSSGTAALQLALITSGVQPGDYVLVPSSTYVATANAVMNVGAFPYFIDSSMCLKPFKLRQFLGHQTEKAKDGLGGRMFDTYDNPRRIVAVIPVHLLGHPCDMQGICEVANEFGIMVIEDAAEALGSRSGDSMCGTIGLAGILSFNNNKTITTNGGGALLTADPWIAARAAQLAGTARIDHPWIVEHDAVGFNFRMGDINAAMGIDQMSKLPTILSLKKALADKYENAFRSFGIDGFYRHNGGNGGVSNHWLSAITVDRGYRDAVLKALHDEGIHGRALFTPLHTLPMYQNSPRTSKNMVESETLFETTVCLPSGPGTFR